LVYRVERNAFGEFRGILNAICGFIAEAGFSAFLGVQESLGVGTEND
jgi:hypothetical protein